MSEEKYIEERVGKRNPFLVPEGYFESLTAQVMQSLPERKPRAKSVWMRPWLYAAACICALIISATLWFSLGAGGDTATQKEVADAIQEPTDTYFDDAADYVMLDNQDIYIYLADY